MFGLFTPKCPFADPRDKAWTETGMLWLAREFGIDRMRNTPVLLPAEDHFPDAYHGSTADAERLMQRLCDHMQINATKLSLQVHPDEELPDAAGMYEATDDGHAIIRIAEGQLGNQEDLLATLAHELSHQLLLGEQRLTTEDPTHEEMADLLPVFLGLGVFGANATVRETMETSVGWHYWSIRKQGYLPARLLGYALALFAWVRGETRPEWGNALRLDARDMFWKSLKYLAKTEDSVFRAETAVGTNHDSPKVTNLVDELENPFRSQRIVALWRLRDFGADARDATDEVLRTTTDSETAVRAEAVAILPQIDAAASTAIPQLLKALKDPTTDVRFAAAKALGFYTDSPKDIVPELTDMLIDRSSPVARQAATSLAQFGSHAEPAAESLVKPLRSAIIACADDTIFTLLGALACVHPDPDDVLATHFADDDPEFLRRAQESLTELREMG